jgi:tetratricopeptide (TPR) repeat protein
VRPPIGRFSALALVPLLLLAPATKARADEEPPTAAERAAKAYDAGRCGAVLGLFEGLPEKSRAALDGVSLYRWGFCLASVRREDPTDLYRAAAARLSEATADPGASLDEHFYRVNAFLNLRDRDAARAAAAEAVERYGDGALLVPEGDPNAWFRLGKLHRDAGDETGALEPFARAITLAEDDPDSISLAYAERIANAARVAGRVELAQRALAIVQSRRPRDPRNALRLGRNHLAANDLDAAEAAFREARRVPGDTGMSAQYALETIERIRELRRFGLEPATNLADGTPIAEADLRTQLADAARRGWELIRSGESREVARKRREGTRPAPTPEVKEELRLVEAEFVGLLRQAILVGADIRGWAVASGYAPLIHHPWRKLFVQRVREERREQVLEAPDGS